MSGNKPSPTAGWLLDLLWFTQDAFESSPWPGLVSGDLLFARWRSHPLGNSWRRMHLMYLLGLFAPIQVDVPEFSKVKNPLTPAAAPPTASANQPLVTRRKLSLFGGYGRNPNCSNNQGWIGQRLTLSDFTASKLVSFSNWLDTARSTSLTFGSTFFGWFGWLKTLESDKSSRLLVRRMAEWLSGKTRPCNPQNSEPSPILPEMSGNKPSPTAGWLLDLPWFTQDAFESSPWPGFASGYLLFFRCRSHHLGNSWRRMPFDVSFGPFCANPSWCPRVFWG